MYSSFRMSEALAGAIVEAAKEVIGHDVNFINPDGKIIASTDKQRIGTFHQAGMQVHGEGRPIEVTASEAYLGSRQGINYPVIIDGQRIGVIGISGDPDECRSLGFLLTKITEVLIKEQMLARETQSQDELRSAVTRLLVFGEAAEETHGWRGRLSQLGVDMEEGAFVLVVEDRRPGRERSGSAYSMHDVVQQWHLKLYTYLFPNQYIAIAGQSRYKAIVQDISAHPAHGPDKLTVGIGSIAAWEQLSLSYRHARLALQYAVSIGERICEYESLELGLLLAGLDPGVKRDFAGKRLGGLTSEERMLLRTYFLHNLSLKETAAALYMHKNTLQYRLDKIAEKTGLDPRQFRDSVSMYLALLVQDEDV
ncbi:sugar diacid recognition domain-containing protein [Paenibacillus validus]|uniref:CdaR family transcriptional regulator n=1 Tax=Paenibacillus TaxID=44249 RepID=UPI000FD7FF9C|nr:MULTISPECIES: sugar diacid recognition domain-containing protein [Paenibacillus]MED4603788.1 sugar diacid recognition domain-containing protein [Paenibacillus validus]MED4609152.1 sugar diacid recognition domain-containing protein [Paenibacillus validus]